MRPGTSGVAPCCRTARAGRQHHRMPHASATSSSGDLFDAYDVLGVPDDADAREIRSAFIALQKQHHPDVNKSDQGRSADVNRAYDILTMADTRVELDNALLRANGGRRRGGAGRTTVISSSGLVGPLREKFLLGLDVCGGALDMSEGGEESRACDVDVVLELTETIREWGKMLAFTSEMPFPLPLQCDDIDGGLRLAMITFTDGRIREVGALSITVEVISEEDTPGGGSGAEDVSPSISDDSRVEVRVCRMWVARASQEQLPGENRIVANFVEEFAFLMDDGLRGQAIDGKEEENWLVAGVKGFASNITSFALPVLPVFGSTRGVMPGGSYDAYRINRSGSGSFDDSMDETDLDAK